jgi:hypothetical protein
MASGGLLEEPLDIPAWQIGLALLLGALGVVWMFFCENES